MRLPIAAGLALVLIVGCAPDTGSDRESDGDCNGGKCDELDGDGLSCSPADQRIELAPIFGGVRFTSPVAMVQAPGDGAFFVVEKRGVIWRMPTVNSGAAAAELVVDFRSQVNSSPNEAGLLGVAFHPDFQQNGEVFFSYTAPSVQSPAGLQSRISRLRSIDGGDTIEADTEQVLLSFQQPFVNHNGGHIEFGPDGLLYAGFGDGGSAGDPQGNGQNRNTILGSIIRIDVDRGFPYAIPSNNPFAQSGGAEEIYAWGLRNPWRFHWDDATDELWVGDVGQNRFEEIDVVVRGGNYGWSSREGAHCFGGGSCNGNFINPVAEYGRSEGISVTGGYVYRGDDIPALRGTYIFGDFGSGRIWGLVPNGGGGTTRELLLASGRNVASFARDTSGELYAVDHVFGAIFRVQAGACEGGLVASDPAASEVEANFTFLSRDGVGTIEDALAYYAKIAPEYEVGVTRLSEFVDEFIDGQQTVSAFYRNNHELDKWREMVCTETLGRGAGACFVRNWDSESDFAGGTNPGGTVAMNVSPSGFTRFYAFDSNGRLSPTATLDSEGPKFVPYVCTPCHNGQFLGQNGSPNLGAIFREFEPSTLQRRGGVSDAQAQAQWLALNSAAFAANGALASQAQGGPVGIDHSKQAMTDYIRAIYESFNPPVSRPVTSDHHIPPTWQTGHSALAAAKAELWTSFVNPYCMSCHRNNSSDFFRYEDFIALGPGQGGVSVLRQFLDQNPSNPGDLIAMPQAEPLFFKLRADAAAQAAVDAWEAVVSGGGGTDPDPDPPPSGSGDSGTNDTPRAIPDNDPAGASSSIALESSGSAGSVQIFVDIQHSFRGDLAIRLTSPSGTTQEVAAFNPNDGADDVRGTADLGFAGESASGTWTLTVVDRAAQDTGTIRRWSIGVGVPAPV